MNGRQNERAWPGVAGMVGLLVAWAWMLLAAAGGCAMYAPRAEWINYKGVCVMPSATTGDILHEAGGASAAASATGVRP